jgi:regulator of Ty1 transposition protein 103
MSFSEASLLKKFQELNSTQQSVQTLSLWLIHHRRNAGQVIATWLSELERTPKPERKLTFIYLANDILQNSRRKGDEYLAEFRQVLREAFEHTAEYSDEKTKFTLERY